MCVPGLDPVSLALLAGSTAASVGGGLYNASTQNKAIAAQNAENQKAAQVAMQARAAEQQRQNALEHQQAAEVTKSLMQANPTDAVMRATQTAEAPDNGIAQSAAAYNDAPPPAAENKAIEGASQQHTTEKRAATDKIVNALAMLTALGGEQAGVNDRIQLGGSKIRTLGGFRQGSSNANAMETAIPAAAVTPSDSIIGDLLLLGGSLGSGMAGKSIGGAAPGGSSIGDLIMGIGKKPMPTDFRNIRSGGLY